jgi:hypothetical protein
MSKEELGIHGGVLAGEGRGLKRVIQLWNEVAVKDGIRSIFAVVSEIGLGFSPDIENRQPYGLQPLGHVFFPISTMPGEKRACPRG